MAFWDKLLDRSIYYSFDRSGFLRHQKDFVAADLDISMKGKVCLVTGANSGLGLATVKALAERQATVYLLSRNADRGQQALETVARQTGNEEIYLEVVDLSSPASIRSLVSRLELSHIDVLIHNAGSLPLQRELTSEGLELTVATHLVGPFLLTSLLQQKLAGGRVVFVSSGGMYTKRLDVRAMLSNDGAYDGIAAYAMTKRGQVVLGEMWAEKLAPQGTVVSAMHPGWAETPGVERSLPGFWRRRTACALPMKALIRLFGWRYLPPRRTAPVLFGSTANRCPLIWSGGPGRNPSSANGCGRCVARMPVCRAAEQSASPAFAPPLRKNAPKKKGRPDRNRGAP